MQRTVSHPSRGVSQLKASLGAREVRLPARRNFYTCQGSPPWIERPVLNLQSESVVVRHRPSVLRRAAAGSFSGDASDVPLPAETSSGRSTFIQAVFNCVNVMMGVGLLSLPFALKSSGWIGIALLWLMGIVTNYTGTDLLSKSVHATLGTYFLLSSHAMRTGKALVECSRAVAKRKNLGNAVVG